MTKKKWTAFIVALALLVTLIPAAAMAADENSSIDLYAFDQNQDNVVLFYQGMDGGDRYMISVDGDYDRALFGSFPNANGSLILSKEEYPLLNDVVSGKKLTIEVRENDFRLYDYTKYPNLRKTVTVSRMTNRPEEMTIYNAILSREGKNEIVEVAFDENYEPGFNDSLVLTPYDEDGNALSGAINETIDSDDLRKISDKRHFSVRNINPPRDAATYRVEFRNNNITLPELTKTVEVGDYFGVARRITLDYGKTDVVLGEKVTPEVYITDNDGNQRDVSKLATYVYSGDAIASEGREYGGFTVNEDSRYAGSRITVTALYANLSTSQTLNVIDQVDAARLTTATGQAGETLTTTFQLIDSADKSTKLDWTPTSAEVTFRNATDPTALLTGKVSQLNALNVSGTGVLELSSSKATKADVIITLKGADNRSLELNAGTFTFTAKPEAPVEEVSIIMGIGSDHMIINGKAKQIDTVPVIQNDRTFVPLRALSEGFGAKVDFEESNRTVTVTLDGKVVVMTIGQTTYTVDGKAAVMDVAPFIDANSRTMVPVRFMAEALGFDVEATFNADGTTANVIFTNK